MLDSNNTVYDKLDREKPVHGPNDGGNGYLPRKRYTFINRDPEGTYVIDRDPKSFAIILNYLRTGDIPNDLPETEQRWASNEAEFFGFHNLKTGLSGGTSDTTYAALYENDRDIRRAIEETEKILSSRK